MLNEIDRWIPSRAGILNVWRYYDEVLEFHDGRLLLRGANGSGKSKALELLLPFLFDASLRANRLSTFGTNERTMHWNMMGEGASGVTRVGYVWLEFHRDSSVSEWFTCGARLQATSRTSNVHVDYFTTSQRIGAAGEEGVLVITDADRPITRKELEARIGSGGVVHDGGGPYRDAVRKKLFPGLSEQRYDALITALLQLRMPKLSQRLDPGLLSGLLSKALPPLGHDEIADLAEGFERLDAQRERLDRLAIEAAAVDKLARQQRSYAQQVMRARAGELVAATTELSNRSEAEKESAARLAETGAELERSELKIETLAGESTRLASHREGLMKSEAYKVGSTLDELRNTQRGAQQRADGAADAAMLSKRAAEDAAQASLSAAENAATRAQLTDRSAGETRQAAQRCGMVAILDEVAADPASEQARMLIRNTVQAREDQLRSMEGALEEHRRVSSGRESAEAAVDAARQEFRDADGALTTATDRRADAVDTLRTEIGQWAANCHELALDPAALTAAADVEPRFTAQVTQAVNAAIENVTSRTAVCVRDRTTADGARNELRDERARIAALRDIEPAAPRWRTTDRSAMAGAPLWRLVDFADGISTATAVGVEAALESAGLLDAWVGPGGEISGHDVYAAPGALEPLPGPTLADVLVALDGTPVPVARVNRLLMTIAFGESVPTNGVVAIGADGTWRVANLIGSWSKDQPEFIGAEVQARKRARTLAELDRRIGELDSQIDELDELRGGLERKRSRIDAEYSARPDRGPLVAADSAVLSAQAAVTAADRSVHNTAELLRKAEAAVRTALHSLNALSATTGLPPDRVGIEAVRSALRSFGGQADTWLDHVRDLEHARSTERDAARSADLAGAAAGRAEEAASKALAELVDVAEQLQTIEDSVGREYREVLADIASSKEQITRATEELENARRHSGDLRIDIGKWQAQSNTDRQAHRDAIEARDAAAQRFRVLARGTLPADAEFAELDRFRETLDGSDGVRAALEAARMLTAAWPTVSHTPANVSGAFNRLSSAVHECRAVLSSRADLELENTGDVQIFTAVIDGIRVGAAELKRILHREAEQSKNEITEHERTLFDKTLTGDTRRHLADRIRQANGLVKTMNDRLARVRTASDVAVQLQWRVGKDLPAGTKAARELLLKEPAGINADGREALHQFLRDRIDEAKSDDSATSWEQQLARVFDYTAWHQFVVMIDRGKGEGYQELTKKLHGALSGGEKAIALHLPLFAAVAAHYQATPTAPRVIMLDEVFVGVDTVNRGQIFALLSALDLDLILTSDHEWCMYSELSGIAIHQIVTGDESDAVTTARFTWDGAELVST
ncbi:TIGR02680 family protein [Nocardia sp. NPDC058480]|uniref:TIGR02680 family protein n=1 Tax=Nocardia sp. NPDC058480 TaxID=3346522 RepID=UPI00365AFA1C